SPKPGPAPAARDDLALGCWAPAVLGALGDCTAVYGKEPARGAGGLGSIPGSGRSPGGGRESPGVIPGIVGAVVVALGGAISSFIAYQKKKLCFKENAEEGEVNMENHRTNAEPAVQQTLLEK
ncbi:unnamed protein product, partial [Rangifer tarandus platyrhynchus]